MKHRRRRFQKDISFLFLLVFLFMYCIVDVWISYHFRINILSEYIFISMRASAVLINGSLLVLILPDVEDKIPINF